VSSGAAELIAVKLQPVNTQMRIAILEDDAVQAALVEQTGIAAGHDCHLFADGDALVKACRHESFDLFVLDWEVPGLSGRQVLDWIRANVAGSVPVMFCTGRLEADDVVSALQAGADDYMKKPVNPRELRGRIAALLRRAYPERNSALMEFAPYVFDTRARRVRMAGAEVKLTDKEFDLALFLFRNAGRLVSRGHLLEAVWGLSERMESRTLDTHFSRLRSKLKLRPENGFRLVPVYSYGYRLERIEDAAPGS
jgi:DNA-binding response OmpR family regulator